MKQIDLTNWPRKHLFDFFKTFDSARYCFTLQQDVTAAYAFCKQNNIPFSLFCTYCFLRANNELPSFRLREIDGKVFDIEQMGALVPYLFIPEIFTLVYLAPHNSLREFCAAAKQSIDTARTNPLAPPNEDKSNFVSLNYEPFYFTSHTPGHFTFNQSVPVLAWGKFKHDGDRLIMPYALQVNHMFIDGIHIGQFADLINSWFENPQTL